jgi:type IV pilus assembly protein PilV
MRHRKFFAGRARMTGISMVEALVALVVISVGMLGIAGLYLASLKAGRTANLRVQAVNLVSDMADRIRANKRGEDAYDSAGYGGAPDDIDCESVTCLPEEIAEKDLHDWFESIDESLRNLGAVGTVDHVEPPTPDDTHRYQISVTWREAGEDADSSYSVWVEL